MNWAKLSGKLAMLMVVLTFAAVIIASATKTTAWQALIYPPMFLTVALWIGAFVLPEGKPDALATVKTKTSRWRYIVP